MATAFWPRPTRRVYRVCSGPPAVKHFTPLDFPATNAATCSCYTRRRLPWTRWLERWQEMQANAKPTAALGDGAPGSEDPTLKLPKVSMLQLRLHLVERTCLAVHDHVQAATCRVGCRGL